MNTWNPALSVLAVFILLAGGNCTSAFAVPVYVYGEDSFDLPIPSPADPDYEFGKGWMVDALIEIENDYTVYDLDVSISLKHTKVFDLKIILQNPAGTSLCLNEYGINDYFDGEDYVQTIFDDEAVNLITDADPPFTGRFKPKAGNQLSLFDGESTKGIWRLRIQDKWQYDTGTLESFKLMVTVPEPATMLLLALGGIAITLSNPNRIRNT